MELFADTGAEKRGPELAASPTNLREGPFKDSHLGGCDGVQKGLYSPPRARKEAWFWVLGLGVRGWGSGFRVQGSGFRV